MMYTSDIQLGREYVDVHTGLRGRATAIYFFEYACERVNLEYMQEGKIKSEVFDAPRLQDTETRKTAQSDRPGGPAREPENIKPGPR